MYLSVMITVEYLSIPVESPTSVLGTSNMIHSEAILGTTNGGTCFLADNARQTLCTGNSFENMLPISVSIHFNLGTELSAIAVDKNLS